MKIPDVFPFYLEYREGNAQFQSYFQKNRAEITEKYGHWCYTGRGPGGQEKSWSYYEVDAEIIDEVTIKFQTYGMRDSFFGGRGDAEECFTHVFPNRSKLRDYINARKQEIATHVRDMREIERLKSVRETEIDEVYYELFAPLAQRN